MTSGIKGRTVQGRHTLAPRGLKPKQLSAGSRMNRCLRASLGACPGKDQSILEQVNHAKKTQQDQDAEPADQDQDCLPA